MQEIIRKKNVPPDKTDPLHTEGVGDIPSSLQEY
jgi:hypothetical protein